jgi:DNA (cytosine-5)-methyltransferase 1
MAWTASQNSGGFAWEKQVTPSIQASPPTDGMNQQYGVRNGMQVRRFTPVECERLQGFPDNFTRIPYRNKAADRCPDGPRYKALGNSMAVPVMRWIGERIQMVEALL